MSRGSGSRTLYTTRGAGHTRVCSLRTLAPSPRCEPIITPTTWTPIAPSTLADQAYQAVRDRILDGDLAPGEFVREQDVSEALEVSRTPVREALGRLASEGFLERIPHRGFRVPPRSLSRLTDLYPIVSALELLAGQLAFPNVDAAALEELRRRNERLEEALAASDVDGAMAANEAFHEQISELSGNARLSEMLSDLRSQLRPLERWYYSSAAHGEQSVREHATLVAALETRELERALGIFARNMALTLTTLREKMERGAGF